MKKILLISLLLLTFMVVPVMAQTAEELYSRAVNKYFLGDNEGAIRDLNEVLSLDPGYAKAKALLSEIKKESGKPAEAPVIAPPAVPKTPRPTSRPVTLPPTVRSIVPKKITPEVSSVLPVSVSEDIKVKPKISILGLVLKDRMYSALLFLATGLLLILVLLEFYLYLSGRYQRKIQVCPECGSKNSHEADFCHKCGVRFKIWGETEGAQRAWLSKMGWRNNPFSLDVIPGLFTGYALQVNAIMEKINARSGHILVYGNIGVGKTTLLRWLTEKLEKDNYAIYVARPPVDFQDIINYIVSKMKGQLFSRLGKFSLYDLEGLIKKARKPVVILLDEAHEFTERIEQQMRTLGDMPNVVCVLAGLPRTREKIKEHSPPFFDRIVLEVHLEHLGLNEIRDLIRKRIESVGGKDIKPFTEDAIDKIFRMSGGRPRMVLKICDWVMAEAIRKNLDIIGVEAIIDLPAFQLEEERASKAAGKTG